MFRSMIGLTWGLIDPDLDIFVSVMLLDIVPDQHHCVQNHSIKYLSRDAHGFWDTVYECQHETLWAI
jgi:hypothetical protein